MTQPTPSTTWNRPEYDPKAPKNRRKMWLGLAAVGAVVLFGPGLFGNHDSTATADPKPPATHTAPAPAPKPAPAPEPTQAEQVADWATAAEADMDAFATHNGEMAELFADPYAIMADSTDAENLIGTLADDVDALRSHGPIPAKAINKPWQKALDAYADGYALALDGVQTMNVGTLTAATDKINQGSTYIDQATAAIGSVTV